MEGLGGVSRNDNPKMSASSGVVGAGNSLGGLGALKKGNLPIGTTVKKKKWLLNYKNWNHRISIIAY